MLTICMSPKGGQGCSTVAAMLAMLHPPSTLVDAVGDIPAVLGMREPHDPGLLAAVTSHDPIQALNRGRISIADTDFGIVPSGGSPDAVADDDWRNLTERLTNDSRRWIFDIGTSHLNRIKLTADQTLMVIRPCYLALRRSTLTARPTGVVLITEPGRSLGSTDIERVIGAPVVATLELSAAVARTVDAGLLATGRLPDGVARQLSGLLS